MECREFKEVAEKLSELHDDEPRKTEPWEEICLTILSQNTNDDNRDKAFKEMWRRWSTPQEILDADTDELIDTITPAGLKKSKSEYLRNAARYIVEERNGDTDWIITEDPMDVHDELTSIKGVGHKTADVILMFSADAELCPVDTHVHRVANRLGVAKNTSRKKTRDRLLEVKDECGVDLRAAHIALIWHGRRVCKARTPLCSECIVEDLCEKNGVDSSA